MIRDYLRVFKSKETILSYIIFVKDQNKYLLIYFLSLETFKKSSIFFFRKMIRMSCTMSMRIVHNHIFINYLTCVTKNYDRGKHLNSFYGDSLLMVFIISFGTQEKEPKKKKFN